MNLSHVIVNSKCKEELAVDTRYDDKRVVLCVQEVVTHFM